MSLYSPKPVRLRWCGDAIGWVVDVPTSVTNAQLLNIAKFALPAQVQRFHALMPGDKKDECKRAVEALQQGRVTQRVLAVDGGFTPFASTERVHKDRTFFFPTPTGGSRG
jgi:hypothetical protein